MRRSQAPSMLKAKTHKILPNKQNIESDLTVEVSNIQKSLTMNSQIPHPSRITRSNSMQQSPSEVGVEEVKIDECCNDLVGSNLKMDAKKKRIKSVIIVPQYKNQLFVGKGRRKRFTLVSTPEKGASSANSVSSSVSSAPIKHPKKTEKIENNQSEQISSTEHLNCIPIREVEKVNKCFELTWYCLECKQEHGVINNNAMTPFLKKCGWKCNSVAKDGDCLFNSVAQAQSEGQDVKYSVLEQRRYVADQMTNDTLETYLLSTNAFPEESYYNFFRPQLIRSTTEPKPRRSLKKHQEICMNDKEQEVNGIAPVATEQNDTGTDVKANDFDKNGIFKIDDDDDDDGALKLLQQSSGKKVYTRVDGIESKVTNVGKKRGRKKKIVSENVKKTKKEYVTEVESLEDLKKLFLRLGSEYGPDDCLWADEFAVNIVANLTNLAILFIDIERGAGLSPYRLLACSENEPTHIIILKRQGPVGHYSFLSKLSGQSCFPIDHNLPPVMPVLWHEHILEMSQKHAHIAKFYERVYSRENRSVIPNTPTTKGEPKDISCSND